MTRCSFLTYIISCGGTGRGDGCEEGIHVPQGTERGPSSTTATDASVRMLTGSKRPDAADAPTEVDDSPRRLPSNRPSRRRRAIARHAKTVRILGTHGVPANYGGFETAAENVALFLHDQGWRVVVYCQAAGRGPITTDVWKGIERVHVPVDREGWLGTSQFDWLSISHAAAADDI